jgi:hypothetical protein
MKRALIGLGLLTITAFIGGCSGNKEEAVPPPAQPVAGGNQGAAPPAQPMESGFAKKKL